MRGKEVKDHARKGQRKDMTKQAEFKRVHRKVYKHASGSAMLYLGTAELEVKHQHASMLTVAILK